MSFKGSTRDVFLFDCWLLSKKSMEADTSVGVDLVGMVKTNTKAFCKAVIEGLAEDWPGGSYIVLRSNPMVPGEIPILDIGYKYNSWNIISFVAIEGAGITTLGILYLSKYPDQFYNVSICPVARSLPMYKLFGSFNDMDSHKKSQQLYLELD